MAKTPRTLTFPEKRELAGALELKAGPGKVINSTEWQHLTDEVAACIGKAPGEVSHSTVVKLCDELGIEVRLRRAATRVSREDLANLAAAVEALAARMDKLESDWAERPFV